MLKIYGVSTGETRGTGVYDIHSCNWKDASISGEEYFIDGVLVHQFFIIDSGEVRYLDHDESIIACEQGSY